ncbi:MAG: hypothetical protein [Malazfec virus 4]
MKINKDFGIAESLQATYYKKLIINNLNSGTHVNYNMNYMCTAFLEKSTKNG